MAAPRSRRAAASGRRGARARRSPGARRARPPAPPRACRSPRGSRVPSARPAPGVGERAAPGRCRRRGRARSSGTDSSSGRRRRARRVGVGEVGGVHGGEARAERAGVGEHGGRRVAVGAEAGLVLGRLLGDVGVERALALGRPLGDGRARLRVDRADAVDRGADPRAGRVGELGDALGPGRGVAVARSARWTALRRLGDAAVQVAGVEQGDADPGLARRRRSSPRPSRWGRRTGGRRDRGAGSGTRRPP